MTNFDAQRSGAAAQMERQRILAARGWETDTDRRRVVRTLLAEKLRAAYLWSYAKHRNRDRALERARTAVLKTAHSLGQIPDECSFQTWIFLELRRAGGAAVAAESSSGCPEPWRIAALAERPTPAKELSEHLETCSACRNLLDDYRFFLSDAHDPLMVERSSWQRAVDDLERFLEGYFGDAEQRVVTGQAPLRDRMPLLRLTGSRLIAGVIGLLALGFVLLLLLQNLRSHDAIAQRKPGARQSGKQITVVQPPAGPHLEHIDGTGVERRGNLLAFQWAPLEGADQYRLTFLTAKLDTLHHSAGLTDTRYEVPVDRLAGYVKGNSFLFKVDARKGTTPVGTSGFVPFSE